MILNKISNYNSSKYAVDPDESDTKGDVRSIDKDMVVLFACLQGRVRFGPGTSGNDGENIAGQFLTITTSATPNAESTFTHSLGGIPVGYLIIWQDKAGSLYQGPSTGTAWSSSTISFKCSVASVQFKLFLLV